MSYILSPEQQLVCKEVRTSSSSDIKYFDLHTAYQTIENVIIEVLEKGEKVLIHIPDSFEKKQELLNLLAQSQLSQLTIDTSSNSVIPDGDFIKMRSIMKGSVNTDIIIQNTLATENTERLKEGLVAYYTALDKKVLSNIALKDYISNKVNTESFQQKNDFTNPETASLEFSSKEFYAIKKQVEQAVELFDSKFLLYDHLDLIDASIWKLDKDELTKKKEILEHHLNKVNELDADFEKVYKNLIDEASNQSTHKIKDLEKTIIRLNKECLTHSLNATYQKSEKKGFSLFGKKNTTPTNKVYKDAIAEIQSKVSQIDSNWSMEITTTDDSESYEMYSTIIQKISKLIGHKKTEVNQRIANEISKINKINATSKDVVVLDSRLNEFISSFAEVSFFTKAFNHNALSFNKQLQLCKELKMYIQKCHTLLNQSTEYAEWNTFLAGTKESFQVFFDGASHLPKQQWLNAFDSWYSNQLLATLPTISDLKNKQVDYIKNEQEKANTIIPALVNKLTLRRLEIAEELKLSSKELYNTLFKKKAHSVSSWNDISLMNRPFLQDFFPLHIQNNLVNASDYDLVLSLSPRTEETSTNHHFSPILPEDIENRQNSSSLFLYLNHYGYTSPLAELTNSEKLKAAKKLSKYILSLNQRVKIYQIKSANIISLLPSYDAQKLEQKLENYGLNIIDTDGVLYDRLTESILFTDRKPFLIIKDELFNSDHHEHLLWQISLRAVFEKAGYTLLSVNSNEQIANNDTIFNDVLNALTSGMTIADKKTTTVAQNSVIIPAND